MWFSREPIGKNKLATILKDMCAAAGITGYRTNHSLCATTATRLYSAGTDEQLIGWCAMNSSLDGVRSYKRRADHLTEDVSSILNRSKKPCQNMQSCITSATPPSTASLSPSSNTPSSQLSVPWPWHTQQYPAHVHAHEQMVSNTKNTAIVPGSFYFNSCGSIVINVNNNK